MKRFKEVITIIGIIMFLLAIIYGVGWIKYKLWRAEHPQAETWTFFIPDGNKK